jgi:hypothetical protein
LRLREKEKEIDRLQEGKEKGGREGGSRGRREQYFYRSSILHISKSPGAF